MFTSKKSSDKIVFIEKLSFNTTEKSGEPKNTVETQENTKSESKRKMSSAYYKIKQTQDFAFMRKHEEKLDLKLKKNFDKFLKDKLNKYSKKNMKTKSNEILLEEP